MQKKNILLSRVILPICFSLLLYAGYYAWVLQLSAGISPSYVNGILVTSYLIDNASLRLINYRGLLERATKNDAKSIKKLTLLEFHNGIGYDHGTVIVSLIETVGEDNFIQSLTRINNEQKRKIRSYIKVGLAYGHNPNFENKTFEEVFPKIYIFLNRK